MKNLTASNRKSLIRLASSLPKGSDERKAILAGLKAAGTYISPKVEPTPVMLQAIAVMEKLWPYGLRLERRDSKVRLGTYREGYVTKKVYGQVSTYPSVGGDYNIPYQATQDSEESLRAMVNVDVYFYDNGKVEVVLRQPKRPISGRQWADDEEDLLFKGTTFGGAAVRAVKQAKAAFDMWEAKFE